MNDSTYNFKVKGSISSQPVSILRPEFISFTQTQMKVKHTQADNVIYGAQRRAKPSQFLLQSEQTQLFRQNGEGDAYLDMKRFDEFTCTQKFIKVPSVMEEDNMIQITDQRNISETLCADGTKVLKDRRRYHHQLNEQSVLNIGSDIDINMVLAQIGSQSSKPRLSSAQHNQFSNSKVNPYLNSFRIGKLQPQKQAKSFLETASLPKKMLSNKDYAPKLENNKVIFNQRLRSTKESDGMENLKPVGTLNSDLKVLQDILFTKAIPNVDITHSTRKHPGNVRFEEKNNSKHDDTMSHRNRSIVIPNITMNLDLPLEDSEFIQLSNPNNYVASEEDSTNQDSGSKPDSSNSSLYDINNENCHFTNFLKSPKKNTKKSLQVPQNRQELKSELKNHLKNRDEVTTHQSSAAISNRTRVISEFDPISRQQVNNSALRYQQDNGSSHKLEKINRINRKPGSLSNTSQILSSFSLPNISAQSYAIYDMKTANMIIGRKENLKREVASLTKIMTFFTVYEIIERAQMDLDSVRIKVSHLAANISGTTAQLKENDTLTVRQLLYGLMLPSGNDSAILLAEYFGEYLSDEKFFNCQEFSNISNNNQFVGSWQFPEGYIKYFLKEMNANSFKLRMFQTNFDSPHGMANKFNYSTAYDICLLTNKCMQIPFFRQVVGTQIYQCFGSEGHNYLWENTNKLLGTVEGFIGCKTGITDVAGPCFSGVFETKTDRICVIVLNSRSMEQRWVEVPLMVEWAVKRRISQNNQGKHFSFTNEAINSSKMLRGHKMASSYLSPPSIISKESYMSIRF